jgi:uncharacterized cupredoxin-like copper-binding protein
MKHRTQKKDTAMRKIPSNVVLAAALTLAPAYAAGPHDHGHHGHKMSDEMQKQHDELEKKLNDTSAFGVKGDPKKAARIVKVEASEIMYDLKSLDVKLGETVKFVLVNKGEQAHELTVGDAAYQEAARKMMTMMGEMGMDPSSPEHAAMHAGAGNTAIAQVGKTAEVAWTFTKAGKFEFSCNMIGHSEAGMKGAITVK